MYFNRKYELCAGKKNEFPESLLTFRRRRKKSSQYKKEIEDAEKLGLTKDLKPTKYVYRISKTRGKVSLRKNETYPYDW